MEGEVIHIFHFVPLFFNPRPLLDICDQLRMRVQQLEDQRAVQLLQQEQLITLVAAAENRVRAMVNRAEKATRTPIPGDHNSDERQLTLLDTALLRRKFG